MKQLSRAGGRPLACAAARERLGAEARARASDWKVMTVTSPVSVSRVPDGPPVEAAARRQVTVRLGRAAAAGGASLASPPAPPEVDAGPPRAAAARGETQTQQRASGSRRQIMRTALHAPRSHATQARTHLRRATSGRRRRRARAPTAAAAERRRRRRLAPRRAAAHAARRRSHPWRAARGLQARPAASRHQTERAQLLGHEFPPVRRTALAFPPALLWAWRRRRRRRRRLGRFLRRRRGATTSPALLRRRRRAGAWQRSLQGARAAARRPPRGRPAACGATANTGACLRRSMRSMRRRQRAPGLR